MVNGSAETPPIYPCVLPPPSWFPSCRSKDYKMFCLRCLVALPLCSSPGQLVISFLEYVLYNPFSPSLKVRTRFSISNQQQTHHGKHFFSPAFPKSIQSHFVCPCRVYFLTLSYTFTYCVPRELSPYPF